jgi:hypothetical protein
MFDDWEKHPGLVLVVGISAAAVLAALLWGLAQVIPAVGVAIGLAFAVAGTGLATSASVASWVAPVASTGLGIAGTYVAYLVVVEVVSQAKKAPFEWAIPILSIFAAFLVDLCKEFIFDSKLEQILFAGVTAFLVLAGGFLLTRKAIAFKIAGFVMPLLPPAYVIAFFLHGRKADEFMSAIKVQSFQTVAVMVGMLVTSLVVIILGLWAPSSDAQ